MASGLRVPSSFLSGLKALFPESSHIPQKSVFGNPWYIVAAVAFSASNRPEAVPQVFQYVLEDLKSNQNASDSSNAEGKVVAQKLREALFKSGLTSGYPKAINALKSLHECMPEEWKETQLQRNPDKSLADYSSAGDNLFNAIYGQTATSVWKPGLSSSPKG
ncbi:hypothetical protein CPC08DRAFT_59225 [Agrocybe pediades]|nr:hypothetical protein CPC08DRAFT_59225 [Agrocybe pediades]